MTPPTGMNNGTHDTDDIVANKVIDTPSIQGSRLPVGRRCPGRVRLRGPVARDEGRAELSGA